MPNGVIGLEGFTNNVGELTVTKDYVSRMTLPGSFDDDYLKRASVDCELLAKMFREHPSDMKTLLDACIRNDIAEMKRLAEHLGLSEEQFIAQGGGLWHLIVILVVVGGHIFHWW